MTACYYCGDDSHPGRDCPKLRAAQRAATPAIPAHAGRSSRGDEADWCGFCDEQTRLIDAGGSVARCQECHPLRRRQLAQCRKCPRCNATVYLWDYADCGRHRGPGLQLPPPSARPESTR